MTTSRPPSLELLDELRTPGSGLRRQLCVAVSTISSKIANEQQRALAQTAQAFRNITRCKVTVIAPMPDINTWTEGDEYFVNPSTERHGPPPGQASMMREAMQRYSAEQPADADGPGCVHTSLPGGEERMQMVFNERACAENSDEHMAVVAERIAASNNCAVAVSTGGIQLENLEGLSMQADSAGPAGAAGATHAARTGAAEGGTDRAREQADVVMATGQAAQVAKLEHSGSNPGTDTPMDNSPPNQEPGVQHSNRERENGTAGPSQAQERHTQHSQHHHPSSSQAAAGLGPHGSAGPGEGMQQAQSVQCAPAAVRIHAAAKGMTGQTATRKAGSLRGLTGAVALLDSVEHDTSWQVASHHGGSLKGRGVDLLAALHSQRPCSSTAGRGNGPTLDDRPGRKRGSVLADVQEAKPFEDTSPPPRAASQPMHAGDADGALAMQGAADVQPSLDSNRVTRNGFTYPTGEKSSYLKLSPHTNQSIHSNTHMPNGVQSPFGPAAVTDPATAMRSHHQSRHSGVSLHDKVQRAEGMHDHPAAAATSVPCTGTHDPAAVMAAQHRHHSGAQHTQHAGAQLAAAPSMQGVPDHRLVMPAAHRNMHAEHAVAAGQFGPVRMYAPPGAAMAAAGPGLTHPGDMAAGPGAAGAQVSYVTADPMHRSPSVHSVVVGPPGGGAAPVGMVATVPHVNSMGSMMNSAVGHTSEEIRALRNKVNRADGGIGRKLTMDVLQQYFGRGLKEAAESLGMCPTTLKRACRRLGVKRWPRTPEMATQAIAEAQQTLRQEQTGQGGKAGASGAPMGDGWQSGGVDDDFGCGTGADQGGLDDFEMERRPEGRGRPDQVLAPNGQIGEFDDFWSNVLEASE